MPSLSPPAVLTHSGFIRITWFTAGVLLAFKTGSVLWGMIRVHRTTTRFRGPSNSSFLLGRGKEVMSSKDPGALFSTWISQFGPVFPVPAALGSRNLVVSDPIAISHIFAHHNDFVLSKLFRAIANNLFGPSLLGAQAADHARQRRQLAPAFNNVAIRDVTPVFFDSAYKVVTAWDAILAANPLEEASIEVQTWMNRVSLDSIGIAGFDFDFESLQGKGSSVADVFDSFGSGKQTVLSMGMFLLSAMFPILLRVPTERVRLFNKMTQSIHEISTEVFERVKKEKENGGLSVREEKSLIGLLSERIPHSTDLEADGLSSQVGKRSEHIVRRSHGPGYETTPISLTWSLIELARNPEIQTKLRQELADFSGSDPSWNQLNGSEHLPWLDAIVHEVLRLRPPISEVERTCNTDQVVPLGTPIATADGVIVDRICVAEGQTVVIPMASYNRLPELWGDDADDFIPERWFREESTKVAGLPTLLTFIAGPRVCLGKSFALAEFKTVLSVLIRNYEFELPSGVETVIEAHRGVLLRPKIFGEDGPGVPLKIRKVVQ